MNAFKLMLVVPAPAPPPPDPVLTTLLHIATVAAHYITLGQRYIQIQFPAIASHLPAGLLPSPTSKSSPSSTIDSPMVALARKVSAAVPSGMIDRFGLNVKVSF